MIQKIQEEKLLKKYAPKESVPTEDAIAYKKLWGKYGNYFPMWGWYYASRNGNMDVRDCTSYAVSSCLRIGDDKARIDNVTAGGMSVGIHPDGAMDKYAYHYFIGERIKIHS